MLLSDIITIFYENMKKEKKKPKKVWEGYMKKKIKNRKLNSIYFFYFHGHILDLKEEGKKT